MLRVAICDADVLYREQIGRILFHILFDVEDVRFTYYESGVQLIQDVMEEKFQQDILITELVLPGISGLKALEFIRKLGISTDVIILTGAVELAPFGYRLKVFDFIEKPLSVQHLEQVMNRYIRERLQQTEDFLNISIQGCQQRLRLGKIQFFESQVRKILAVMGSETVEFYYKMDELDSELRGKGFFRCHQSYIVNQSYILGWSGGELQLFNRKKIPVSRKYTKEVRRIVQIGE